MKVLITGAHGFMGKHLIKKLKQYGIEYFSFDVENTDSELTHFVDSCDFIVHFAGVMRPLSNEEFYNSNFNLSKKLVDIIKRSNRNIPILLASSTQATLDNDYGRTKKMCEDLVLNSGLPCYVFRFTNAFGKWGKPNYNSVASTFFYNIAHNLDIYIRDPNYVIHFIYIDDIIDTVIKCINGEISPSKNILSITPVHDCTIGHLADLIRYFKKTIESDKHLPIINDDFELKLFISFCDYFSDEDHSFNYCVDSRGTFEEIFKSKKYGQISINKAYPGVLRGGHYHTYKEEIFQTIKGKCLVRTREINSLKVEKNVMDGSFQKQIHILPNKTHDIQNVGNTVSITLIWISEIYSEESSDTYKMDI